jgi:putative aminopeptidase FrvX
LDLKETTRKLIDAFGVSGDEFRVAEIAADLMRPFVDRAEIDQFGNVTGYRLCGRVGAPKLLIDAHIDQIGFMVTEITEQGFLRFVAMGVDQRMLQSLELVVLTRSGQIPGVVCAIPAHQQKSGEEKKVLGPDDLVVDLGMSGETARKTVRVGDYMVFADPAVDLQGDTLCGKAIDDRSCLVSILHALELIKGKDLNCDLLALASTKEELGGHGAMGCAYTHNPDLAIALDVCHARTPDNCPADTVFEMGKGPVVVIGSNSRPLVARRVLEIARAKEIPYQVKAVPGSSGTNAWSMQLAREGVQTLIVSIPVKYMHTPAEMISMKDVENTGRLLSEICLAYDIKPREGQ